MDNIKFSIVIPSFNQGRFIEATLLSIFNQTYQNYEVIVMDGGSRDQTVSILKRYEEKISYWQSEREGGQSDAIAKGFLRASGDVFCWLNSDDVYLPSALESVAEFFNKSDADVVYGNKRLIDQDGKLIGVRVLTDFLPNFLKEAYLCGGFGIYQPSSFWRADLYKKTSGVDPNLRFSMDNELFNQFIVADAKFCFVNKELSGFRVHETSKTSTQQQIADVERAELYKRFVTNRNVSMPGLKRFLARFYRLIKLTISGKIFVVLQMRYMNKYKWVP